jgi:signal transduction histidine kinase
MHRFLTNNRDELLARCKAKVAERPRRAATSEQLRNGIPLFIEQLTRTLQAEEDGEAWESLKISGASGGDVASLSQMGVTATAHGKELLELGYTVDQVVHDYGDLCQAITDLAVEKDAPFTVDEFRTLNRCLDNAIADAVLSFSAERDVDFVVKHTQATNLRLGLLVHELRTSVVSANLAAAALEKGNLTMTGATGGVLKRSLAAMAALVELTLSEVKRSNTLLLPDELFSLAALIAEAKDTGDLDARTGGHAFSVPDVDPMLAILGNRGLLLAALMNLLQNAFKFTHAHTEVTLHGYAAGDRIFIDVKDNCGGLSPGEVRAMFKPFSQRGGDKIDLGMGLSIARESVEADGGVLTVRDVPGTGCVFTISLPLHSLH